MRIPARRSMSRNCGRLYNDRWQNSEQITKLIIDPSLFMKSFSSHVNKRFRKNGDLNLQKEKCIFHLRKLSSD